MGSKHLILILLVLFSGVFYYHLTGKASPERTFKVDRVIDGDTIVLVGGRTLRLKGINAPEKSMPYYKEAKEFVRISTENKTIFVKSSGTDRYGRTLAYVSSEGRNINRELLVRGLATLFYYDKDKNYERFRRAEEFARINQNGLWKESPNKDCLKLVRLKIDEPEELVLQNSCGKKLKLTIKDDATHIYHEVIPPNANLTKKSSHIWNNGGDSLYVSDAEGMIIFYRYPGDQQ